MNICSELYFVLFTVFSIVCLNHFSECLQHRATIQLPKCEACEMLVESFLKGIKRTDRANFEGGNTDWEERNLGSYSTSEVRFVEIQENLCKENKTTTDQCQTLAEQLEDYLEQWWADDRWEQPDLRSYLCLIKTKYCLTKQKSSVPSLPDPAPKTSTTSLLSCPKGFKMSAGTSICGDINECSTDPCNKDNYCVNTHGSFHCRECHPNCAQCVGPGPFECTKYKYIVHFLIGSWLALYKLTMVWPTFLFTVFFIVLCANFVFKSPLFPNIFLLCVLLYFSLKILSKDKYFENLSQENV